MYEVATVKTIDVFLETARLTLLTILGIALTGENMSYSVSH